MASTFVKISRDEFEDWLYEICPVFERVEKTEGVYLCPVSDHVAVKVSSTIGRSGKVVDRGNGACRMSFVSRHNPRALPKPPKTSDPAYQILYRTKNWAKNWRRALEGFFASLRKHQAYYDTLAQQTQAEYAAEWTAKIESVKDYERFSILVDFREVLQKGEWLSYRQEATIWKFLNPRRRRGSTARKIDVKGTIAAAKKTSKKKRAPMRTLTSAEKQVILRAIDDLQVAAHKARPKDDWTIKFTSGDIRKRLHRMRAPTTRQAEVLREKLRKYKIRAPNGLAAALAA